MAKGSVEQKVSLEDQQKTSTEEQLRDALLGNIKAYVHDDGKGTIDFIRVQSALGIIKQVHNFVIEAASKKLTEQKI